MQQPPERNRRKNSGSWIGILIFLFLVLGPQIARVISQLVSQITGGTVTIGTNIIPLLIGGVIIVATLIAVGRALRGITEQSETRLPTSTTPPPTSVQRDQPTLPPPPYGSRPSPPPAARNFPKDVDRSDINPQQLPGTPRFEPIVDGKVLLFGIVGAILIGVVFVVSAVLSGALP